MSNSDDKGPDGLVFGDVGGWISGPCLDAGRLGGPRFGLNVGAWMTAYPDFVLQGSQDGRGFRCRRRNEAGRPSGLSIAASSLDELADVIDLARGVGGS